VLGVGLLGVEKTKTQNSSKTDCVVFDATPRALTRKNILQQKRTEKGA
jgi:hypothetical protein